MRCVIGGIFAELDLKNVVGALSQSELNFWNLQTEYFQIRSVVRDKLANLSLQQLLDQNLNALGISPRFHRPGELPNLICVVLLNLEKDARLVRYRQAVEAPAVRID